MSMRSTNRQVSGTAEPGRLQTTDCDTMARRRRILAIGAASLALVSLAPVPSAVAARDEGRKDDHDEARHALLAGEVRPLRQVLDDVARDFPGEPVKIEFERDDGVYVYEIKLLQPSGAIVKLKIDARTGAVLKLKGRNIERRTN